MIKWRSNLKRLTCSIAPLVIALFAIGSSNITTQSMPAQLHGPQIDYLANGANVPNQFKITTFRAHRANRTINSSKFRILADYDQPDGTACNNSNQCESGCCIILQPSVHVCVAADQKNANKNGDPCSDQGCYTCVKPL